MGRVYSLRQVSLLPMPEYRASPISFPCKSRRSKYPTTPPERRPMFPEKLSSPVAPIIHGPPLLLSPGPPPTPTAEPNSIEALWRGEFNRLFINFSPHAWYISPTARQPSPKWRRFKDSAKVRFCCQTCGHGWTSMKGRIVFWFHFNHSVGEGFLQFKLYGQQCQRCKTGNYEFAMWYPEEVQKVLTNVYNRVGQAYYGFMQQPYRLDRRIGKPRKQHNADLCQACKDGECDNFRAVRT
ncbi:receptor-transporting protein 3-like [Ptychodera flava]|uniref:receptor-transporting protein 3-like n=1 Tax=Ptychodera flava TaxID=63121 RepID=UPI003969BBD0